MGIASSIHLRGMFLLTDPSIGSIHCDLLPTMSITSHWPPCMTPGTRSHAMMAFAMKGLESLGWTLDDVLVR